MKSTWPRCDGIEVSAQFISRATDQLQQQIVEWQSRPLDRLYPVVYVDGLRVAVRTDKGVIKKCVYVVLGVSTTGRQKVLGLLDRGNRRCSLLAQSLQTISRLAAWSTS